MRTQPMSETVRLRNALPCIRLGSGRQRVVVIPGLVDALWDATTNLAGLAAQYGHLAGEFAVYVISRIRGLPTGYTTRDMAADYAQAIENEIGPTHVVGISAGGFIAQHLAADFPQCVKRLVIACAAHRPSEEGRRIPERWLALARERRWREFYLDIARVTLREFHHTAPQLLVPLLRRTPPDSGDFLRSLEACIAHDATNQLPRISAPTLVIAGQHDLFFPEALLRETAALIPNATLYLLNGSGHGAHKLRRNDFENTVVEFLRDLRL
jgi:pimeloyl-ACP methyl ester carboxylesterase